jgi:pyridoxamine 5'-phosphate oxidase
MDIGPKTSPQEIFESWIGEAKKTSGIKEPTAMTLSTAGPDGEIHSRVVLCKSWSDLRFVFYTNYQSRKGLDLAGNSNASAVFFWDPLSRQITISGQVEKTSRSESEAYWNSRPRESQLSQFISRQSQEIASREELEAARVKADKDFSGRPIPCPEHWGGFALKPARIEFWVGRPGRLHDRFQFQKQRELWTFRRLYP